MGKRTRIIEGTWKCRECDTDGIPGRDQKCPACGSPREDTEAKFDFGERTASGASVKESVENEQVVQRAKAGEDWNCQYCEASNVATAEVCKVCSAPRWAKEKKQPTPPATEPEESGAGAAAGAAAGGCGCGALGVAAVLAVGVAICAWSLFSSSDNAGEVVAMSWERTITIEAWEPVTKQGFRSDMPKGPAKAPVDGKGEQAAATNVRDCKKKEKTPAACEEKTVKEQCGTEEKCEVKDLGNGFAEEVCEDVPKYCDKKVEECTDPVMDEWCTYDTHEWKEKDKKRAGGKDDDPSWPKAKEPKKDQRQVRTETYTVTIRYPGGTHVLEPTAAEFGKWSIGDAAVVSTNPLGGITGVQRAQ